MEECIPDIETFMPYELKEDQLDYILSELYMELKTLYDNERSYKIDLVYALKNLLNQQRFNIYCKEVEKKWNQ
jgi:hypothetical protein